MAKYLGNRPTAVPLTSEDIQDGVITAADLGANSVDSSELVDNSVTLAKMAGLARGKLIYGDASGDPAALTVGSANQVLTADGTDFAWAAAAGGGKILQVKVASNASGYSGTSSSWTDATNFAVTITPASTSNHILIGINPGKISFSNYYGFFSAKRAISGGTSTDNFVGDSYGFFWGEGPHPSGYFPTFGFAVDAPNTTSAITYTAQFRNHNNSSTVSFGSASSQGSIFAIEVDGSTA